jgi:hypothetical protein
MTIDDLYELIKEVEWHQKYLFIVYTEPKLGIDVLEYNSEDVIDGAWFNTVDEAIQYVDEYGSNL